MKQSGDSDGRDILCEACHGFPKGTHPLTDMIVTRTNLPLNTAGGSIRPSPLGYATKNQWRPDYGPECVCGH